MTPVYESLQDGQDSETGKTICFRQRSITCVGLVVLLGFLAVLGILLAIVILERPPPLDHDTLPQDDKGDLVSTKQCSMSLVESIPPYVEYEGNVTRGISLIRVWKHLLSLAAKEVHIVSFYWSLTGEDINVNSTTSLQGKEILRELGELPSRNISVRVISHVPSIAPNSTDLEILEKKGVQVRKVDFGRLTQGVLHSKFWIIDRKHLLIGSANMDWRSLTQVKELGVVFYNCSRLAQDLHKIFQSYWVMGESNSTMPRHWPPQYDTDINKQRPLLVKTENVSSSIYLSASPPSFCPASRTQDLQAILSIISESQHYVDVAVMDYFPTTRFQRPRRYWPFIDDALRVAAFERNIKVRMLLSCSQDTDPAMLAFLKSLASMDSPHHHISIQVKVYIIPAGNQTDIPFSRINHNKYMVTDKAAYIGTSNWCGDYFLNTAGVGVVVSQHAPARAWQTKALQHQLREVFDRDWSSEFAVHLSDLDKHPNCRLST